MASSKDKSIALVVLIICIILFKSIEGGNFANYPGMALMLGGLVMLGLIMLVVILFN